MTSPIPKTPTPPKNSAPAHKPQGTHESPEHRLYRLAQNLTPAQEKFCQLMAAGTIPSATAAAREAGYSDSTPQSLAVAAHKLLKLPHIQLRIQQIRDEAKRRYNVTIEEVITNLRKARQLAFDSGKYSDAIKATELLGRLIGAFNKETSTTLNIFTPDEGDNSHQISRLRKVAALGNNSSTKH